MYWCTSGVGLHVLPNSHLGRILRFEFSCLTQLRLHVHLLVKILKIEYGKKEEKTDFKFSY